MIDSIHARLILWSEWCIKGRKVSGLGYPSQCAFSRLTPSSRISSPNINEQAWLIEKAIHQTLDLEHQIIVNQFYLHTGTAESHAKALGISRDKLYSRLHAAHQKIIQFIE